MAKLLAGMRAGVAATILSAVLGLGKRVVKSDGLRALLEIVLVFVAVRFLKISIMNRGSRLRRRRHPRRPPIRAPRRTALIRQQRGRTHMIYLQLFWSMFQIGLFSIGGGYASLPLIQRQVVELHGWLTMTEFTDVVTISEMTPGPVAINSSSFVGMRIAGLPGAIVSTFGCVLPSCIIVMLLAMLYKKYGSIAVMKNALKALRPAVVAMIASAALSMLLVCFFGAQRFGKVDIIAVLLFALAFILPKLYKKISPIAVILGSGVLGLIAYTLFPGGGL